QLRVPGEGGRGARPGGGRLRRDEGRCAAAHRSGQAPPRGQRTRRQGGLRPLTIAHRQAGARRPPVADADMSAIATADAAASIPSARPRPDGWLLAAFAIAALVVLPLLALGWTAAQGSDGLWS